MKKITSFLTLLLVGTTVVLQAQQRYLDEVFTDSEITVATDQPYGLNFNPYIPPAALDGTQIQPLMCDVYMPDSTVDNETNRPVVIYLHTGSFLPPIVTNSCTGTKEDSAAVAMCRKFARHGFVAVSATYRVGWLANSTDLDLRRGTNLLAVYYSIQDAKTCVRFLNATKLALGNPYGIDPSKTILVGQGSGGYTTFAFATIDNHAELVTPTKFQYQGSTGLLGQTVSPGDPYVDTALYGDWDGFGAAVTVIGQTPNLGLPIIDTTKYGRNYENHKGLPDDVLMVCNMGGALGDSSWMEQGDVPMVGLHAKNDFFAPYEQGMVQVPVGQQFFPVVFVQGTYWAMNRADALGNNDIFKNAGYTDVYWTKGINNMHNLTNVPGIFTMNMTPPNAQQPWVVNSAPWDYWDSTSTCTNSGNPNIIADSKAYIDTAFNYFLPRMITVLNDAGMNIGVEESTLSTNSVKIFPNPAHTYFTIQANEEGMTLETVEVMDVTGKVVYSNAASSDNETRINVNGWSAGMYIVRIKTSEGIGVQKLSVR